MEGRGKRSDSGQPQGFTRLGVGRGQGMSFMGQRLGPRAAEALGLLGGICSLGSQIRWGTLEGAGAWDVGMGA